MNKLYVPEMSMDIMHVPSHAGPFHISSSTGQALLRGFHKRPFG